MSTQHVEFPELTPEARAAVAAGYGAAGAIAIVSARVLLAAFLHEAIDQAKDQYGGFHLDKPRAIADNLHSPPPPPPTLAQARAADLETQEGIETVRAFLATLGGVGSHDPYPVHPPAMGQPDHFGWQRH